jgi:eukaryotic-like serine/threonine-protein kinase
VVQSTGEVRPIRSARWERIQELFHAAAELPSLEQRAFLQSSCASEEGLMADVLALLSQDAHGSSPLDRDVAELARGVLAAGPMVEQLGPYRIVRLLGEGGMGVVYLAERTDLGSLVAIKLLSNAGLSPSRLDRFAREQRMLARLDHPAIARLYDAGVIEDGTPFFVMEYVDGKPLTEHCRERAASIAERLGLFRSLCEAVRFAHQHAIIHRDIKPSNVMVKSDGSVRLLDFGIAKHLEHFDAPADQTRTGLRLMTPAYAAPEQLRGDPVGLYTDVYSLGVVLYELLTGRLPFDRSRRSPPEIDRNSENEPDKPSTAARTSETDVMASRAAWADLDVLVLGAMHREPQRRYASVDALIRDLDHYLRGEPLEARPDSVGYRLRKFLTRNWRSVSLAATTIAVILGLVGFFTARIATARDAAVAQSARTQRIQKFMIDLLTGGDQETGPDKDLRVVTVLERGAKEAGAFDKDPDIQAELFVTLGRLFRARGAFDRADALLREALKKQTARSGEGSVATMEPLVALGELHAEQARYVEAEQQLRKAMGIGRRHLREGEERTLRAEEALAELLVTAGRSAEAIPLLEEIVRLQSAAAVRPRGLSKSMTALAVAHFYLGHYSESEQLNRRTLPIARQEFGERHPNVAENLYNLGAIQVQWGHLDQAETYYREALAIVEGYYGRDHLQTAEALTMLSRALGPQRKLEEDAAILKESLAIREHAYGKVHPKVASTLSDLAAVALWQGRFDEAEAQHRRVEAIYREVLGEKHFRVAVAHGNVANVYLKRKDYVTAERMFKESLAMFRETLPVDHSMAAEAEIRIGRTLVLQKRYVEAETYSLAGYTVLARGESQAHWLVTARADLLTIYEALGQPEKAARFRAP